MELWDACHHILITGFLSLVFFTICGLIFELDFTGWNYLITFLLALCIRTGMFILEEAFLRRKE